MTTTTELHPPTFTARCRAVWIDTVVLIGAYLFLGFSSRYLFDVNAYPPPHAMQLYSERDFHVFWFFVVSTIVLTTLYLFICYRSFGVTLGQQLVGIRMRADDGGPLQPSHIRRRILIVLLRLFIVMIPGPLAAMMFIGMTVSVMNPAFSMTLLVAALLSLLFRSYTKYKSGQTRSWGDRRSGTVMQALPPPSPSTIHHGGLSPP